MLDVIAVLAVCGALVCLLQLSIIDLRHGILPNELVITFGCAGFIFHLSTVFLFLHPVDMAMGAAMGAGLLYAVRMGANRFYGQDALGLGDVKLMGAAGIWLGPHFVLLALVLGALAGIVHGLGFALWLYYKKGQWPRLAVLALPAGPGFAVGIVLGAAAMLAWPGGL